MTAKPWESEEASGDSLARRRLGAASMEEDGATSAMAGAAATTSQGKVTGLIFPPPDIRAIVDKTAQFVANNGRAFESRIIGERMSAKFSFLRDTDPYHAYYEHKVSEFAAQKEAKPKEAEADKPAEREAERETEAAKLESPTQTAPEPAADAGDVVVEKKAVQDVTAKVAKKIKEKVLEPPDEDLFSIKHPQLSALDQEIMYLTAQYTALSGKTFLSGLATREQRNPQFDFLKPTHPLFAYFTSLVESYALVLAKSDKQMKRIEDGMERMQVLDRCVHKLEWVRTEQERTAKEAAESDAERMALAQIDWYDFVVVETITFDDEEEAQDAGATGADAEAANASDSDDMDMDDDDDDEKPQIKVVEDYVPQAAPAAPQTAQLMSVDGKTVSTAEANEHMRILLMNPKWREETQRHLEKQKESSYAAGSAIADSLRRFATKRADIFSSSAEEEARLREATSAPPAASVSVPAVHEGADDSMEDDIQNQDGSSSGVPPPGSALSAGAGYPGAPPLGGAPAPAPGAVGAYGVPGAPPAVGVLPPGMPPPFGAPPTMGAPLGAPLGAGPPPGMGMGGPPAMGAPPGMGAPTGMGLPPGMGAPGMGAPPMGVPGFPPRPNFPPGVGGPPGSAPGVVPPGPPGMAMSGPPGIGPPGVPGALPPGVDADSSERASKRQRTDGSSLLTEDEFAALHKGNVRLVIKVPSEPDNAQWKLEGQTIIVEVDIKATLRGVKEQIMKQLEGMPVNKQQLKAPIGFVKDSLTCAHYNFVNGTVLELSVRQRGGRR